MNKGDFVQTEFDTGAFGYQTLYGVVVAAGPKIYRVQWESTNTNRLKQGDHRVIAARDPAEARAAMDRSAALRSTAPQGKT